LINRLAHDTVRRIAYETLLEGLDPKTIQEILAHARKSASRGRIKAMLDIAKWFPEVTIHTGDLDSDPWLLNCQNGTLNLRTGQLQPHQRDDLISKIARAPYIPDAQCPGWTAFVSRIMGNDPEKIHFLQRIAGYWITGVTHEQCLFVFHGPGANGKTTFIEIFRELLGEFARHTNTTSLLRSAASPARNDLARLHGARLVSAAEVAMGKKFDEGLIKQLTGGDPVTARFLYREFFEFKPQFKLVIAANHKPEIQGVDHGIWRRVILVPFNVVIPADEIDKNLPSKLRGDMPGILAWAVRGCREWQDKGLMPPQSIKAATAEYRAEMDLLENFIADRCIKGVDKRAPVGAFYTAYQEWSGQSCLDTVGKKVFGNLMKQKGYSQIKSGSVRYWQGLGLISTLENVHPVKSPIPFSDPKRKDVVSMTS
jgi:putative DNA primase/helicase